MGYGPVAVVVVGCQFFCMIGLFTGSVTVSTGVSTSLFDSLSSTSDLFKISGTDCGKTVTVGCTVFSIQVNNWMYFGCTFDHLIDMSHNSSTLNLNLIHYCSSIPSNLAFPSLRSPSKILYYDCITDIKIM